MLSSWEKVESSVCLIVSLSWLFWVVPGVTGFMNFYMSYPKRLGAVEASEMSKVSDFLFDKVLGNDLALVEVFDEPGPQMLKAKVLRIYSTGKGLDDNFLGRDIEFIRGGRAWGNKVLEVGDQALLFVRRLAAGSLHEDSWRGHMVVEEIDGDVYAIFQFKEMWLDEKIPNLIREHARQDPRRSYSTAVRFDIVESYLLSLVEKARAKI